MPTGGEPRWIGPFPLRGLGAAFEAADPQVDSVETGVSVPVHIPPLGLGELMLGQIPVDQSFNPAEDYLSLVPWSCRISDALLYGPFGCVRLRSGVVTDLLPWEQDGVQYRREGAAVRLLAGGRQLRLDGLAISLLGMIGLANYYHWIIDGLGRLAAVAPADLARCRYLLVPRLTLPMQRESLDLLRLTGIEIVEIDDGDEIAAAELLRPYPPMEEARPHPMLCDFYHRMASNVPGAAGSLPRRIYIDRRNGINRPLVNETEVIDALRPDGFVPVRLETMSVAEQIALFRNAECIVAPHGAGLANLVFASPGCRLVELQMNSYVNWMFRVIAALAGVSYDCVIGRQLPDRPGSIHGQHWAVSVMHVRAAVAATLAPQGRQGSAAPAV